MNFNALKAAVATQFARMQSYPLFRVSVDKDELWSTYLSSFPVGTNPIYRERTEHDCSCCRHFIRTVGDVVALIDGELESIWDVEIPSEPAYEAVTGTLSELVRSKPILAPFYHYERSVGTDKNFEQLLDSGLPLVKTWDHFHVNLDKSHVKPKPEIPAYLSERRSQHDVYLRGLREITYEAIDTVLELIAQGSLYRGEEHKGLVSRFRAVKEEFDNIQDTPLVPCVAEQNRQIFAWSANDSGALYSIRNTAIGSLLVDLSEGKELDDAVRSFESKVAPTNYKRTTALITPAMIQKAKDKLTELGLRSALDRRLATLRDINVCDLIFTDRAHTKSSSTTGDVFDDLSADCRVPTKNLDKVEEVSIDRFINDIVPLAQTIEVMFENRHQSNLVSLIAPCDPTARQLFKWPNPFSWSYSGELADAIKERVKQAGGNVTGDLRCSLAWHNYDDLDLHLVEPGGHEISFMNRYSPNGGMLDVDMNMNAGGGTTREPVENIFYTNRASMREGNYHLFVHQYNRRESTNIGFECEIDYLGQVLKFAYDQSVTGRITVAKFKYSHRDGFEIIESLPSNTFSRVLWDAPTQTFHRVSTLLLSPNHWTDNPHPIGNKHYFFMLHGCQNDGSARGFYNEFLKEELNPYRKVFEVLGSKTKPDTSNVPDQLSGLGFSSTRRDTIVCRVKGTFTRIVRVAF